MSQVQDGVEKVIAYGSRTLSKSERNYCVTDRELLAVKHFMEHYKHYLLGREFVVRTDHQALKWLFSLREPKDRVARWIEALSSFNFTVEYRKGKLHGNADSMSRCPNPRECDCEDEGSLKCGPCKRCRKRALDMCSTWTEKAREQSLTDGESNVAKEELNSVKRVNVQKRRTSVLELSLLRHLADWVLMLFLWCWAFVGAIEAPLTSKHPISTHLGKEDLKSHAGPQHDVGVTGNSSQDPCTENHNMPNTCCPDDGRTRPKLKNDVDGRSSDENTAKAYDTREISEVKLEDVCDRWSWMNPISGWTRKMVQWAKKRVWTSHQRQRCARITHSSSRWAEVCSMVNLRKKQLNDRDIGPVLKWMETGVRPYGNEVSAASAATRHYWSYWHSLVLKEGVLHRKFFRKDGTGAHLQILVPKELRNEVMKQMHDALLSGHLGRKKTREKTLQRFYWYGVREDVNNWVARCDECGAIKPQVKTAKAPLGQMPVGAPLDRLATDVLGPLPETTRGNEYVLVVTDHFTKWVDIFAIPDQTARAILNEVIARFGCPLTIHSDQGRNYESKLFADLCRMLEIRKTRTSPGNPRCNGQSERFNRTLIRMVKAYLKGEQVEWDLYLGCLAAAYRATVQEATGLTPNLLMLGREVRLPAEVMFGSGTNQIEEQITTYGDYVERLKSHMQRAHDVARKNLANKTAVSQKEAYDA